MSEELLFMVIYIPSTRYRTVQECKYYTLETLEKDALGKLNEVFYDIEIQGYTVFVKDFNYLSAFSIGQDLITKRIAELNRR